MNNSVLWALAFAALCTGMFSLVTINRAKDIAVGIVLHGGSVAPGTLLRSLGPSDAALAVLAAVSVGVLVWMQVRYRALSSFLRDATTAQALIALTIVTAWTGHAYLSPGILLGGDTATHISRFLEVARGIDAGTLPTWTNYQYLGAPLLWFTGPLTYVVGGAITAVTGDPVVAIKIFLFTCHIAGAWLFFALMRRLDFRPIPAMVASAGFAGCFAHLHLFLFRGVVPQALTIVGLVLLFYAAEGLMRRRGRLWLNWLLVALATAGLIVNHQPHAVFVAFYMAVFGMLSLLLGRWYWFELPKLALAAVCGGVTSAIAVLPVLAESDSVMIEPGGPPVLWHLPTLTRLLHLLIWRDVRTTWGFDYWAYLGISLVALGVFGLWSGLRTKSRRQLAVATAVCLAFSLFLYNPVVRDVIFLFFLLGILVGLGLERLDHGPRRALLALTALVLIDIGSTSVQPIARNDKGFAIESGEWLERHAPNERVLEIDLDSDGNFTADVGPDAGPVYYYANVQRIAGNHNMAATRVHNYAVAAAKLAEADLRQNKTLSASTRILLELLNVTRIFCQSPVASGCPAGFAGTVAQDGLGRIIELTGMPVVFSQGLVELKPKPLMDKPMLWATDFGAPAEASKIDGIDRFLYDFVEDERPDPATKMASAIAVRSLPELSGSGPQTLDWQPKLLEYTVRLEDIEIRISSNGAGYAQIAHPWFPATQVFIDGQLVSPIQGSIDLMVLPVHAGINVIAIRPGTTSIRRISGWISLAGLLLTAAGTFYCVTRYRVRPASLPGASPLG